MSSDNYVFSKSEAPQGFDLESPYVSKQFNFVNDINSGVYASSGLALTQFDLSSIYNSAGFLDVQNAYITIPLCYTMAYVSSVVNGTLVAPTALSASFDWARLGLKCGFWNLISSADLVVDGKAIESYQPNLNTYVGFKMLSQMSQDDLVGMGMTLGMGRQLDNPESIRYNNAASSTGAGAYGAVAGGIPTAGVGGNGLSNSSPFSTAADFGDQGVPGFQGIGTYNNGFYSRLNRITDLTSPAASNGLYNTPTGNLGLGIMNTNQCLAEFRPVYQVLNANYMCWYDVAVVRLKDLFDSMKQFPLTKKFDAQLRLYLNVGSVAAQIVANTATGAMVSSLSTNTFTGTCPLMISTIQGTSLPATATGLVAGLSIARQTSTSQFGGVNLALSGAAHPLTSCRVYFPMVELKPERAISYIADNRAKKVCYTSILSNTYNNISASSTFSTLVQSGVQRIRGVLIVPFLSGSTNGLLTGGAQPITGITPFSPLLSPFDCAPLQTGPISLININCAVGGKNVLQNSIQYSYQDWLEQVSVYEKIGAGDLGLSCGLLSQYAWEQASRFYYIDCTRGTVADGASLRNLTVTFNNNSLQTIDCLIFTEYFDEFVINVADGRITK